MRVVAVVGSVLAAAALAATLGACGSTPGPSITVYNGQHPQTTDALAAGFTRATGIRVQVRSGNEDALVDQITTEGSRTPADVIYTENSPPLEKLQSAGRLAPLPATTLRQTPSRYDSPAGRWAGVSARVSMLVYNPARIAASALPTSVLGLAAPRYRGLLAFAPGESDFAPIVTSVARAQGRAATLAWLRGIKANAGPRLYSDNETVTYDVNRGLAAFGVVDQYYWYRLRAQIGRAHIHSRLATFAPGDPGYVVDVSGAGVLSSSQHQADAGRFVAYLTSRAGQEIIDHSQSFEYPIDSGVTATHGQRPLATLRPDPVTISELGTGSLALSLLSQAGLL